ncbi:unnamed protein product [Microthlaspi erraticum]|uniref:Uncharacterized protein n=1 Tax=Microthlaspi erraticum TaxID=1685480 RepID=A0A6D2IPT2_9BRAS|nr:unnamed protein product [Microthlaspi erraticum]
MVKRRREGMKLTETEMDVAQHLMHLSDEEIKLNIIKKKKIEELFGKDDEIHQDQCKQEMVIMRVMSSTTRKKKKKFRSLESIYMATRPIRVVIR